ncbi:MAG: F0F1 ATP synthase subunit B [Patescibacteria group bacterium]|nr:F0F1 ATP synthase subunit B [Patescibacteria group bacterium]
MFLNLIDMALASEESAEVSGELASIANESVLTGLGINGSMFLAQLVNFAVVSAILWFLILKPITKKMAERQKMIDDSIANSKKIDENLSKSEKSYQEKIDMAKVEANKIMEKANCEASQTADVLKAKAKKEIEGVVEQARRNIQIEKEEVMLGLKKETADLMILALEKILNEKIDLKKDKELIENALKGVKD